MAQDTVLDVKNLVTSFQTAKGSVRAVDGVSFRVPKGKTVCIAGESGCGKSVTSLSIMGLLPENASVDAGEIHYRADDILKYSAEQRRALRGSSFAMIFQEPMTALNPVLTIGRQISEVFHIHGKVSHAKAREQSLAMLSKVKIPDPERRLAEYPHQMSGGMKQRVMIAIALANNPSLLIADEPTTALDVTIQAQVLYLLRQLQRDLGTGIVFVTHDLGVVAEIADEVVIMYAGRVVEQGSVFEIFENPSHPYTIGLLNSRPKVGQTKYTHGALNVIPGRVPSLFERPKGCRYQTRCPFVQERCRAEEPELGLVNAAQDDNLTKGQAALGDSHATAHRAACFFKGSLPK